ncbi:MAG: hypothetical protein AB1589_08050 [Cyanobacteriota bacterium]
MFKQDDIQPTIAGLRKDHIVQFLLEHLKNSNLHNQASVQLNAPNAHFNSNREFWARLLYERNATLKWVELKGFQIVDWFPRTPGLYHTDKAERAREEAEQFICEENGILFYNPHGKFHMIEGGVGSVRFKPILVEREEHWLCTATSDGYCHSGVPLAIPTNLLREVDFSDYKYKFTLVGQIRFLPKFLEDHFQHINRIPQIYVVVNHLKITSKEQSSAPVKITPMLFFEAEISDFLKKNNRRNYRNKGYVTYAICCADSLKTLDNASDWLELYVNRYNGKIITNFDEQRPAFERVPFSLQNIMSNNIAQKVIQELIQETETENINSIYKKIQINILKLNNVQTGDNCTMSNERTINTGGGNYYESISTSGGNYIQGNYINMSQDLTQAAAQIQELIEQLQKSGLTVDSAQEKVAKDVANQAQNNPTMKDKLVKWGQSLGDATVNDVVKGAVKLAIRSAGIPLP